MTNENNTMQKGTPITWESIATGLAVIIAILVVVAGIWKWLEILIPYPAPLALTCTNGEIATVRDTRKPLSETDVAKACSSPWPDVAAEMKKACPDGYEIGVNGTSTPFAECTKWVTTRNYTHVE